MPIFPAQGLSDSWIFAQVNGGWHRTLAQYYCVASQREMLATPKSIRAISQIVASLRRKHVEQSVSPFDVLRRREEGDH